MENLDRCIKIKDQETICSCRGSIKDIMQCLATSESLRDLSQMCRNEEATGMFREEREHMRNLLKRQRECAIEGLNKLGSKIDI